MSENLEIIISSRNNASPGLRDAANEVDNLDRKVDEVGRKLSLSDVATSFTAVVQGIQMIGSALNEVGQIAREGAISEQIGSVLEVYGADAGTSADAIIAAAKKASMGTIAEFELMINANRAFQFEVAKTPEAYAQLIELATALGRAQGVSDSQALEFLTTGIARESKLILDNLGLMISIEDVTNSYAATLGKTADQLTSYERKQAILTEAYRQSETALRANAEAADTAATQFEKLDANVRNLRIAIGELLAGNSAGMIMQLANAIGYVTDMIMPDSQGTLDEQIARIEAASKELRETGQVKQTMLGVPGVDLRGDVEAQNRVLAENQRQVDLLVASKIALAGAEQTQSDAAYAASSSTIEATNSIAQAEIAAYNAANGLAAAEVEARRLSAAAAVAAVDADILAVSLDKLAGGAGAAIIGAAKRVIPLVGAERAQELAEEQLRLTQENADAMAHQEVTGLDLIFQWEEMQNSSLSVFQNIEEADRAAKRAAAQGVKAMKTGISEAQREAEKLERAAEQAFEALKGKVGGVLRESLNVDVGVDPLALLKTGEKVADGESAKPEQLLLPRADAINEDARRLADIAVKGFESPWYEYFMNKFPDLFNTMFVDTSNQDAVRAQAANLLRNFQEGLEPGLIDKERAKERIRKMLIGEANLEQMAQEIALELSAEFGNSLSIDKITATAQQALGVQDPSQAKLDISGVINGAVSTEGVAAGLRTSILGALDGIGVLIAESINKQMQAEGVLQTINAAGVEDGKSYAAGFIQSVRTIPNTTLEVLAGMLSPFLESINARNAELTGAN